MKIPLMTAFLLISSSFSQSLMTLPNYNQGIADRKEITSLEVQGVIQQVDDDYIVGPGDFFEIIADMNSFVLQVSPEGSVSINRVGLVNISGLKLKDAKIKILQSLSKRFSPDRTFVQLVKHRHQLIGVFGAVIQPSYVNVSATMRISEVIRSVGGLRPNAKIDSVKLIRKSGDTINVNMHKILYNGDFSENHHLQSGDQIYVDKWDLSGPVVNLLVNGSTTPVEWDRNLSIYDYFDRLGYLDKPIATIGIMHATTKGRVSISFAEAKKTYPAPGDTIDILQNFGNIYVGGQVQKSGPQPYIPNAKPITYIYNAGTSIMADQLDKIRVVRANGKYEYIDPINGQIFPGDYIELDMSNLDYANKWTPIIGSVLGTAGLMWQIYYVTIWQPKHK